MEKSTLVGPNCELINELKKLNADIGIMTRDGEDPCINGHVFIDNGVCVALSQTCFNPDSGTAYYLIKNFINKENGHPVVSYQTLDAVLTYAKAAAKFNSAGHEPVNQSRKYSRSTGTN